MPSGYQPENWFEVAFGAPYACQNLAPPAPPTDNYADINDFVATGGLAAAGWPIGARWVADKQLYANLLAEPGWATPGGVQQFQQQALHNNLHTLWRVQHGLDVLYQVDKIEAGLADSLLNRLDELAAAAQALDSLYEASQLTSLLTQRDAKLAELASTQAAWQAVVVAWAQARQTKMVELAALNQAVTPLHLAQTNDQKVNAIWLALAAQNWPTMTPGQMDTLTEVAVQCPADGGDAVWRARTLLGWTLVDDCDAGAPAAALPGLSPATAPTFVAELYPNPVQSLLTVRAALPENSELTLQVYDAAGRRQLVAPLTQPTQQFNLDQWPAGIYFYEFRQDGTPVGQGKLIKADH